MAVIQNWNDEIKVQSPYLYLQSAGSDGTDGSASGHHLRWDLFRNLGDSHIPKGDSASTTVNFNKPDDFVTVYRVKYSPRFPTIVNFATNAPSIVHDSLQLWIYPATITNTQTTLYVYFRDAIKYNIARSTFDPIRQTANFVKAYGEGLIEVISPDKLFFAAEIPTIQTGANTKVRAEAVSVVENVPLPELFVSCRKSFTPENWCKDAIGWEKVPDKPVLLASALNEPASISHLPVAPSYLPPCCLDGLNLIQNGDFENEYEGILTDYLIEGTATPGHIFVTQDANLINDLWTGSPFNGKKFLAVTGSDKENKEVWAQNIRTRGITNFCFSGQLCPLIESSPATLLIEVIDLSNVIIASTKVTAGAKAGEWKYFSLAFNTTQAVVRIQITDTNLERAGNDFGLDVLWLCNMEDGEYRPPCCKVGANLISNPGFEKQYEDFTTDYIKGGIAAHGHIYVTDNASHVNGNWKGFPFSGRYFLAVDGATKENHVVWQEKVKTQNIDDFCFSFQLCSLYKSSPAELLIRVIGADGTVISTAQVTAGTVPGEWKYFSFTFSVSNQPDILIQIIDTNLVSVGNDFGLDELWLCPGKVEKCTPRIVSENIRSVRFDIKDGFASGILLETYDDFIKGADWVQVDKFALTKVTSTAFKRLEDLAYPIDGDWPKFNQGATVNVSNYKDRWTRTGGLKAGVDAYINLSNTDPLALENLAGTNPEDGSLQVSYLKMLKLVATTDFHVARMLGLGHIDVFNQAPEDAWIHLAMYDTFAALDDNLDTKPVRHLYMTIPTTERDYRLPEIPVLQNPPLYGLYTYNAGLALSPVTDPSGYTSDGQSRFISLFMEYEDELPALGPFFVPPQEFCAVQKTDPVIFGLEYKKQGEANWRKPELSHDSNYLDRDTPQKPEVIPIPNNGNELEPIFVHQENENGVHLYAPYGANWFSRPSEVGLPVQTNNTLIVKPNRLLPPSNFRVQLIQEESPRLLTTEIEQNLFSALPDADKTLVRLSFDYFHTHDLNYDFGNQVELFFRQDMPRNIQGEIKSIITVGSDGRMAEIRTKSYLVNTTGETVTPVLPASLMSNFAGGVISSGGKNYIITAIAPSLVAGEGPVFTVKKIEEGSPSDPSGTGEFVTVITFQVPSVGEHFLAVENMANAANWGVSNPLSKVVNLGDSSWVAVSETYIQDGETISGKFRGIWNSASIVDMPDALTGNIIGVYRITFNTFLLNHHNQFTDSDPVEWYNGVVRIHTASDPSGLRKVLEVINVENIGNGQPLVLVAADPSFDILHPIQTGAGVQVNYYPGYKVYLHQDTLHQLDEANILPVSGVLVKKTWMGARSVDSVMNYHSGIGTTAPLIAMGNIEPYPPEGPNGGEYATRPDFYFKSTYTFTVQFIHEPYMAAFYRANEDSILRGLYNESTVAAIRVKLKELGGEDDPYRADRWKNLIGLDYVYDDPSKSFYDATGTNPNGTFRRFPREAGNYRFPKPNSGGILDGTHEPGDVAIANAVRLAIWRAFTPLTEQPLLYQYIKGGSYQPLPIPQKIKDATGNVLDISDPEFAQAPMAKRIGTNQIQFTDFTLDGSGNSIWFYYGIEIGSLGKLSEPSRISGPVYLINTRPPDQPGIKKVVTIPPGVNPKTQPKIIFELNNFPIEQKVKQFRIFRASDAVSALTVRTMELVKTIDLESEGLTESLLVQVYDDFSGGIVPFGDPLYYRIIAARKVTNSDNNTEWAPSLPSKLLLTTVIDSINPLAPELSYTFDPIGGSPAVINNVVLSWNTTCYNGTYYLEKLTVGGTWATIYVIRTNSFISVNLSATELFSGSLVKEDLEEKWPIYHRFRIRVQNSAGLFNISENEKTI